MSARCGDACESCVCVMELGHDPQFHECACGGRWRWDGGDLIPVRWPQVFTEGPRAGERTPFADSDSDVDSPGALDSLLRVLEEGP